jgi:prevent-host-death family protein
MAKRISATEAKNNFGGLLEDVATLGRVDIVRHGRLVAIVMSPLHAAGAAELGGLGGPAQSARPDPAHMIPAKLARSARVRPPQADFDDD